MFCNLTHAFHLHRLSFEALDPLQSHRYGEGHAAIYELAVQVGGCGVVAVASGWVGDGSVEWVAHWVVANCQRQQWLGNETARNANQGLNKQRKTLEMKWKPVGWPSGSSVNSPMASGRSLGAWLCANVIM